MNSLEQKVRTAMRQTGEEIAPYSVPPLQLRRARRLGLPRPTAPRRWSSWLTPLAAAAATAAVVVASLAISATFHGHAAGSGRAAATGPHGAPIGGPPALHHVPPYFVEFPAADGIQATQALVRSTLTGHTLATVTPPRPYAMFTSVSAGDSDRTFVLGAQRYWNIVGNRSAQAQQRDNTTPMAFFLLTFSPATRAARLTRLAIPEKIQAAQVAGVALSPDGSRLALVLRRSIQVITLASGATRTWTWPGNGWIGNFKPMGQVLSWTSDGRTLEFQQWGGKLDSTAHVRLLDTTAPGHSLAAAKVILTFPNQAGVLALGGVNTILTPDGSRIVAGTAIYPKRASGPEYTAITEFSARSGRVVASWDRFGVQAGSQEVFWAGPGGRALVVADPRGRRTRYGRDSILGVLVGNRFTPIPHGAYQGIQAAW